MKPRIAITRILDQEEASSTLWAETERSFEVVRHRAWDYFQRRGQAAGKDWEDWLRAERDLLWKPQAEMFENHRNIVVRMAAPGFDAASIQVTASPRALLVQGREMHCHSGLETRLHFCEFGERLFRLFDLPAPIDPNSVAATLDKGILEIVAGIARKRREPAEAPAAAVGQTQPGKARAAAG
jgi:HSP20 family molecular chaperone IbpA